MGTVTKYKIKNSIIFSRNLPEHECNNDNVDAETRNFIDNIRDKYLGYKVNYISSDLDPDSNNTIYIKIDATTIGSFESNVNLEHVAESSARNLNIDFKKDKSINNYEIEDLKWEVVEFNLPK